MLREFWAVLVGLTNISFYTAVLAGLTNISLYTSQHSTHAGNLSSSTQIPQNIGKAADMHLLQLPAEIRQKILDEVISCRTDPPRNPAASQTGRVRSAAWSGVWHLPPENPSLNLLLVNKRINEDTKAVNKRLKTRYHVDIMFLKSYGLWPTWSVPTLPQTEYIELVEATFRIFEPTEDLDPSFQKSMSFRQGCGGPPSALWVFYRMLVALFTDGPGVLAYTDSLTLEDLPPLFVVKELMIDIIEPVDTCIHSSVIFTASELDEVAQGSLISSWDVGHGPHDPNTCPEIRFAKYLTEYFDHVFSISSRGNEWWAIIYECVIDRIVFRVNGTVYRVYDMEKLIAEKLTGDFYEPDPDRRAVRTHNFAIWKSWLDERRVMMRDGLALDVDRPVTVIHNV